MGRWEKEPRRLSGGRSPRPVCRLPQDRVPTLEQDWVLLEPDMRPLAHTVPAEHRWIELSDGRATVYDVCPPDQPPGTCRVATASPAPPIPCRASGRG
ncbi:DUF6083 domain-containing protein [Streptomyces sp. NPDC005930]|uniref:DUF6083 domain-containing protein n=1 Tax=Streptomyces sp. NPDC005930 TaxID=3364736 RepID=UPI00369B19DD